MLNTENSPSTASCGRGRRDIVAIMVVIAAACLVALRLLSPSLVIVDDATIGAARAEALDELHQVRAGTPIIYFAAQHTLDLEREVRRRGVLFYAQMPESQEQLDAMLARLLAAFVRDAQVRGLH